MFPTQGAEEILNLMVFSKNMHDVATPGFNSLIPAPSIRSLVSTEPNEFFFAGLTILALWVLSASRNKNRKQWKVSCNFYLQISAALPSVRERKFHGNKGCHAALTTIKKGNQHAIPNRNPKHNQAETTIHYSFRHVFVLTKNGENTRGHYIQGAFRK